MFPYDENSMVMPGGPPEPRRRAPDDPLTDDELWSMIMGGGGGGAAPAQQSPDRFTMPTQPGMFGSVMGNAAPSLNQQIMGAPSGAPPWSAAFSSPATGPEAPNAPPLAVHSTTAGPPLGMPRGRAAMMNGAGATGPDPMAVIDRVFGKVGDNKLPATEDVMAPQMAIQDGFHGMSGLDPSGTLTFDAHPGANLPFEAQGRAGNAAPGDFGLNNFLASPYATAGRPWNEADLEPTVALGYTGSLRKGFSGGDTQGYSLHSPNVGLFHADMAQRAAQQNAMLQMMHQSFASNENALNRVADLQKTNIMAGKTDHDRLFKELGSNNPLDVRKGALGELKAKGAVTDTMANEMGVEMMLGEATKAGAPGSQEFMNYLANHFDSKQLSRAALINRLRDMKVNPNELADMGGIPREYSFWDKLIGTDDSAAIRRASVDPKLREFLKTILSQ